MFSEGINEALQQLCHEFLGEGGTMSKERKQVGYDQSIEKMSVAALQTMINMKKKDE